MIKRKDLPFLLMRTPTFEAPNCWASLRQHQPTKYPAYEIQKHPTYGMREQTDKGALLVFPSYYRRERPD